MNTLYFTLAVDGSQAGPFAHAQIVASLQQGVLRRESLIRRADLAEFFAVESYPEFMNVGVAPVRAAAVPRAVAAGARPKAAVAATTPSVTGGAKIFVWGMVALWVGLFGWGAKWAFGKWQESSAASARAEAEKWKNENLPMFRVVSMKKRVEKVFTSGEAEIALDGEVEERDSKRHPVYGRAERSEVWVRPSFTTELRGDIGLVPFEPQWVKVRDGKGFFTLHKMVEPEAALKLLALWEKITVEGKVQYEK